MIRDSDSADSEERSPTGGCPSRLGRAARAREGLRSRHSPGPWKHEAQPASPVSESRSLAQAGFRVGPESVSDTDPASARRCPSASPTARAA